MIYWASAETDNKTGKKVDTIRRLVEVYLNTALAESRLSKLNGMIRYVPIVMPPEAQARYPARSRLRKKELICDCAPQLEYAIFLTEDFNAQLRCYLDGLRECAGHLHDLGATKEQSREFLMLLNKAYEGLRI